MGKLLDIFKCHLEDVETTELSSVPIRSRAGSSILWGRSLVFPKTNSVIFQVWYFFFHEILFSTLFSTLLVWVHPSKVYKRNKILVTSNQCEICHMLLERDVEALWHDEEAVVVGGRGVRSNQTSALLSQQPLELDFQLFPLRNYFYKSDQP